MTLLADVNNGMNIDNPIFQWGCPSLVILFLALMVLDMFGLLDWVKPKR